MIGNIIKDAFVKAVPNKVNIMWPVLKFAASRTASVIGRTILLTNSIKHKKGFKGAGDPIGWKWER